MKRNLILTSAVLLALSGAAGAAETLEECQQKAAELEQQVQASTKTESEKASMTASLNDAKGSDLAACDQVVGRIERELSAIPAESPTSSTVEPTTGTSEPAGTSDSYEPGHASADAAMPSAPGAEANDSADMGLSPTGEPAEGYASPEATVGANDADTEGAMQMDAQMGADAAAGSKLAGMSAADLAEKPVVNSSGEEIGEIHKVVTDNSPQAKGYAVIEYGGVLGVGEKQVLVDLDQLTVSADGSIQVPAADSEDFDAYPEYVEQDYTEYDGSLARLL